MHRGAESTIARQVAIARRVFASVRQEADAKTVESTDRPWMPQAGPQKQFYESDVYEILYGGQAGGGKSSSLVALPIPWVNHPRLRTLFLRRTTPQLDDLLDKARGIYRDGVESRYCGVDPDADYRGDKNLWTFPSGATVRFNHCQHEDDAFNYQGHEYQIVGFDELTHFTLKQYREIASRVRSSVDGLPRLLRATSNPGGEGHEWVFERWKYWLDPAAEIPWKTPRFGPSGERLPPAEPGEVLWFLHRRGQTEEELIQDHRNGACQNCGGEKACVGEAHEREAPQSRTFIPARLEDNPALLKADPDYRQRLRNNDPVRRAQLEDGNWTVRPGKGLYFNRSWITIVEPSAVPATHLRVRAWDKAATEPTAQTPDPDWTRGVRMSYANGTYYIEDLVSLRAGPGPVKALLRATAELDGKAVRIRIPQDPGAAGKSQAADDVRGLDGWMVTTRPVTGSKVTRFGPFSSQASPKSTGGEKGRVAIVRAPWNEELIRELESFPVGHDDIADAVGDAYAALAPGAARGPAIPPPRAQTFDPENVPVYDGF